jgi:hypothetical protein
MNAPSTAASAPKTGGRDRWMLAGVALSAIGVAWLLLGFLSFPGGEGWAYDYQAYADAAVRLAETGSLYQAETLDGPYRPGPYGLYMYAPQLGLAITPLASLELEAAAAAWYVLHVLALALACALLPVRPGIRLATFGLAALSLAVTRDLVLGNVSLLLLLPLAAAWRWLDRPLGSIAQALAMSVRPTLGILLIWQLLRRQWLAVAWTVGAGIALVALTLPFVGLEGYREYLTVLANLTGVTGVEFNYDLSSTALTLGASEEAATLALLVGYAIAIGAMLLSLRRDRELGFVVTTTGSLLLSPLLWDHYLAMLVLPAAFLAGRGRAWGILLPLATWLPAVTLPFVVVAGVLLPFLARAPETGQQTATMEPSPVPLPEAPA